MLSELTIPKNKTDEIPLDHHKLYLIGLKHIQKLSNRIWTDYNVHDPGITILELLCYAITDLGYRASFPIEDILASPTDNVAKMAGQFFSARKILPNRALTLKDYRKLLIDLKGVKNAWLKPSALSYYSDTIEGTVSAVNSGLPGVKKIDIQGLYDVSLEYMDYINTIEEKEDTLKKVKEILHANRNLCEDFVNFSEISLQEFNLCCELELEPAADASWVKAQIIFQVNDYLSPAVKNYSLSEMMSQKKADGSTYTSDEIFDGPLLECGFIPDSELEKNNVKTIRLSDIMSIIMDIKGVRAIRDIVINLYEDGSAVAPENKWIINVEDGKKANLNTNHSRFVFYKRNMPVVAFEEKTNEYLDKLNEDARTLLETALEYDFDIPIGEYRNPESYYSFQNHFPLVYGLSELGPDNWADEKKKAFALQLKAYLLFFDQIMANYFAQLSKVKDLLSTDPTIQRSYFYQVVDSFSEFKKVYNNSDTILENLQTHAEDPSVHADRRNRFLDHLIVRFAERFSDFANIMFASFGTSAQSMIYYKCDFLKDYVNASSQRAIAYNYSLKDDASLWNSSNVSGLERRLARLLGIQNFDRRNLGDIAFDIYAEIDPTPEDEFRFRVRNKDNGNILLSSSTNYDSKETATHEMERAIRAAMIPSNYQRRISSKGKHYFNIVEGTDIVARRIEYFADEAAMNLAIDEVLRYVQVNYSDEGLFLIENILLRPSEADDPFLPICKASESTSCADTDPYSYRLHVILPAFSSRFMNMNFRRFAEEIIREETPAHILPKICWISREEMATFEKSYRDWIYLKAGAETANRTEKLKLFIRMLYYVKNQYPGKYLHECTAPENMEKFILGQTTLGTINKEHTT